MEPLLTHLTSTRDVSSRKPLELSEYFTKNTVKPTNAYQSVLNWTNFDKLVSRNMTRVESFTAPLNFMDTKTLALNFVLSELIKNGLDVSFSTGDETSLIGHADLVLMDLSRNEETPILVGHHETGLELQTELLDLLSSESTKLVQGGYLDMNSISCDATLEDVEEMLQSRTQLLKAFHRLSRVMVINNLSYGYISTEGYTRYVKFDSQIPGTIQLQVSRPVSSRENTHVLLAVSLEAYFGPEQLSSSPVFEVIPEAVESPNLSPLSNYEEGKSGRIKWWIARQNLRKVHKVQFHSAEKSSFFKPGSILVDGGATNANFLLIDQSDENIGQLKRTASMLQFLNENSIQSAPKSLLYGNLLNFQLLALEPFGQQITTHDLQAAFVIEQMHLVLTELHEIGVMVQNIELSNFFVDYRDNNAQVKFLGFGGAKLFRRVPLVARDSEHTKLDILIKSLAYQQ